MSQIVLFGAYGFENLGDKLLRDYYRTLLYTAFPQHPRWIVTAGNGRPHFSGEIMINRWQALSRIKRVSPGDLWIAGGGSLLQNKTSCRSLFYYTGLMELAAIRGARIIMLGQGYGPVHGRICMQMARHALTRAELIECRDLLTLHRLQRMSLGDVRIQRGVDPSWGMEIPCHPKGDDLLLILKQADKNRIPKLWAALAGNRLTDKVRVIALDARDERILRAQFGSAFKGTAMDTESFRRFAEGAGGILSSRLHGIILGALMGLPAIGLGDDPKITGVCNELGFATNALQDPEDYQSLPGLIAEMSFSGEVGERILTLKRQAQIAKETMVMSLRKLGERI